MVHGRPDRTKSNFRLTISLSVVIPIWHLLGKFVPRSSTFTVPQFKFLTGVSQWCLNESRSHGCLIILTFESINGRLKIRFKRYDEIWDFSVQHVLAHFSFFNFFLPILYRLPSYFVNLTFAILSFDFKSPTFGLPAQS